MRIPVIPSLLVLSVAAPSLFGADLGVSDERKQEVLLRFDANNDGVVNPSEQQVAREAARLALAQRFQQLKNEDPVLYAAYDSNGDGRIEIEEARYAYNPVNKDAVAKRVEEQRALIVAAEAAALEAAEPDVAAVEAAAKSAAAAVVVAEAVAADVSPTTDVVAAESAAIDATAEPVVAEVADEAAVPVEAAATAVITVKANQRRKGKGRRHNSNIAEPVVGTVAVETAAPAAPSEPDTPALPEVEEVPAANDVTEPAAEQETEKEAASEPVEPMSEEDSAIETGAKTEAAPSTKSIDEPSAEAVDEEVETVVEAASEEVDIEVDVEVDIEVTAETMDKEKVESGAVGMGGENKPATSDLEPDSAKPHGPVRKKSTERR